MTVRPLQWAWRFSRNEVSGKPGAVHHRAEGPHWYSPWCSEPTPMPPCRNYDRHMAPSSRDLYRLASRRQLESVNSEHPRPHSD